MSREFVEAKKRYQADALEAYRFAALNLEPIVATRFHLAGWSNKTMEAYEEQWPEQRHPDASFKWKEIFRRYREPDQLSVAIWGPGERLCGLGLALTSGRSVELRFLEGDFRQECPIRGYRAMIVLEAVTAYGQARGKRELRIQPANPKLAAYYVDAYGFTEETAKGEKPFFRKPI